MRRPYVTYGFHQGADYCVAKPGRRLSRIAPTGTAANAAIANTCGIKAADLGARSDATIPQAHDAPITIVRPISAGEKVPLTSLTLPNVRVREPFFRQQADG